MTPKAKPDAIEQAFLDAPTDDQPMTAEERAGIDEARAQYARDGIALSAEQVTALLRARTK